MDDDARWDGWGLDVAGSGFFLWDEVAKHWVVSGAGGMRGTRRCVL